MSKLVKGNKLPNFKVETATKKETTLVEISQGKSMMIMVLRYIGCTVCRYDVHELQMRYQEFVDKGITVAIVMQSTADNVNKDLNGEVLPFEIICDDKQEIYKALEINPATSMLKLIGTGIFKSLDKMKKAGKQGFKHGVYEGNEQQLPAFFYVDEELNVIEAHYARNMADMPTIQEMLDK